MKKTLTLIIALAVVFALTLCLSVTAMASDNPVVNDIESGENGDTGSTYSEENPFKEIYEFAAENADKILSALAFLSSLFLIFAYRKGLIPIINKGLSAIGKSSGNFEVTAKESLLKAEKNLDFLSEKFAACENSVEIVSRSIDELTEKFDKIDGDIKATESLKLVMLSQIDMLYEIFMHSSLPQYSKDALGEKVAEMKKSISLGK